LAQAKRVRQKEMDALFTFDEVADGGRWYVAEDYRVDRDTVYPGNVWRMITTLLPDPYCPDPDAFLTFARLASHGNPSEAKILEWVHRHGLLHRRDPDWADPYTAEPDPNQRKLNQEPMDLWDFRQETRRAYQLLRLYELWRGGDVGALWSRMKLQPLKNGPFEQIVLDGELLLHWVPKEEELTDGVVLSATRRAVEAGVESAIAGVRPVFGPNGVVLRCPDLRTAMYWSFAMLMSGKRSSALCEVCGNLFAKNRRDHRICSSTCRSKKSREKNKLH
jgi:hypothetical protein